MHVEELDDSHKFAEDGIKVISQQEYVSRLHQLKDEITHAWNNDDRVTALKLSIKVARLLMDTSVLQFYPTLFILATDVLDMLGDMVWERIRQRAEFAEDGTIICPLPEDFEASNICFDAKETCYNWFCKIGSIRELLPRLYLELAIFPCCRFLLDRPVDSLQRLVMMTRGIADPLASAYCRLYMAYRMQKLHLCDTGHLVTCINDLHFQFRRILSGEDATPGNFTGDRRMLISLVEPTIEYIMKSIFKVANQAQVGDIVVALGLQGNQSELFGKLQCMSVVLHHLLKELPLEVVCSNAVEILHLIECTNDCSLNQCLNYKLLGFRLCEGISQGNSVNAVIDKLIQVVSQYNSLEEYLKVVDAYVEIILQNQMGPSLNAILDGIFERMCNEGMAQDELANLQSVFLKLLFHFNNLEDLFALNHFIDMLDMMHGSSRNIVNMHILNKATRNTCIRDPSTIRFLFEIAQAVHDGIDFSNMRNDDIQQPARLISRYVDMVDHESDPERHFTFLVECRGAFGSINELKETLVHSSNRLAIRAVRDGKTLPGFIKSCLAFSEVTIPSVPAHSRQLKLYIETAEVALLGGLISHSDGLIDSAISCLQYADLMDGLQMPNEVDGILSLVRKLCSLVVIVPGNSTLGVTYIPKSMMTGRVRVKVLCAIVSLSAAISQNELPYRAISKEVISNDRLYFGDQSYSRELVLLSCDILQSMNEIILQEPSQAARGNMALEACNCIASSF
ncbi:hypothetical protein RJ639_006698, partial [Escallonia herrerae]